MCMFDLCGKFYFDYFEKICQVLWGIIYFFCVLGRYLHKTNFVTLFSSLKSELNFTRVKSSQLETMCNYSSYYYLLIGYKCILYTCVLRIFV